MFTLAALPFGETATLAQLHIRDTSIRKTDWMEYFKHSADFTIDSTDDFIDTAWGKFVLSSDTSHGDPIPGGYPGLDNIQYGDLDGDGREEAAMLFYCGGTAGAMSYAVFRQNGNMPSLVEWGDGYKLGCGMRNDTLLIYQPVYNGGWEPNCCPSSLQTQYYRIKKNKLFLIDTAEEGIVEMAPAAVEHFYSLLSSRDDTTAYQMLSKKYQLSHPFKKWSEGFKNTVSSEAAADTMRTSDSTVYIKLTAVDRLPGGENITSTYEGTWKMEWSPDAGWFLAEPKIRKVNKK